MKYKSCSHILHLILTFITAGWWLPVWVICALRVSAYNKRIDHGTNKQMLEELKRLNRGVN